MGRRDRGQSVVELALVLPIVLVLLLVLLQAGVVVRDQILVAQAAREGAREGAVTADRARIEGAARRAAPGLDLAIDAERGTNRGELVTVTVTASPVALPMLGWLMNGRTVRATATMRIEREGT